MFIELKDTMAHIGAAFKTYFVNSVQNTLSKLYFQVASNQSIEYNSRTVSILNYYIILNGLHVHSIEQNYTILIYFNNYSVYFPI